MVLVDYICNVMKLRKTIEEVIQEFKLVHGDRYDYSLVEYTGVKNNVKIICREHGQFNCSPDNHKRGKKCSKCAISDRSGIRRLSNKQFIEKAKLVHVNRYNYSLVDYKTSHVKVTIICKQHGTFKQSPASHLQNHGCPKCDLNNKKVNPKGWSISDWGKASLKSKNFDSFKVYVIKCYNDNEIFYKIGRTFTTVKRRFHGKTGMPYKYNIINEFIFNTAEQAFDMETKLKHINKDNFYTPLIEFNGKYECFSKVNL